LTILVTGSSVTQSWLTYFFTVPISIGQTPVYGRLGFTLSQATKALRVSKGIALFLTSALEGGEESAPTAPYPRERPGTHCTGGWVGLMAGLDWCGKSRPTWIRSPDRPARSSVAIPTMLPGPHSCILIFGILLKK